MLVLPTPEDFGLPDPTGSAPASSLAAPLILPNYVRPPLDHDGILVDSSVQSHHVPRPIPLTWMPEDDLVTCSTIGTAAEQPTLEQIPPSSDGHPHSQNTPQLTDLQLSEKITFHEILDHSLFGRKLKTAHCSQLLGHFPVRPSLRPSVVPADMPVSASYTMAIVKDPPRRSTRLATQDPVPLPQVDDTPTLIQTRNRRPIPMSGVGNRMKNREWTETSMFTPGWPDFHNVTSTSRLGVPYVQSVVALSRQWALHPLAGNRHVLTPPQRMSRLGLPTNPWTHHGCRICHGSARRQPLSTTTHRTSVQ